MAYNRIQRVIWSDILMAQETTSTFTYEQVKMAGPTSLAARPAIYTVKISKSGDAMDGDTLIIGGTTFTAKTSPTTSSGTTEFGLTASASEIATIVGGKAVTGYTITVSGDTITYKQTTAGTGDEITIGAGTSTEITAEAELYQAYQATNSTDPEYNIEPGEPLYLVSTDNDGVKVVAPIDVTQTAQVSAFCGFSRDRFSVAKGEIVPGIVMARKGCELDVNLLPSADQFGNPISYDYTTGSLREKAEAKGFIFGKQKT